MEGLHQFLFVDIFSIHNPYESKGCQEILDNYIASRGGLANLGPTERLRLQVLQSAVAESDWLFLFLHHIVSQQYLNPGFVPPAIATTPNFPAAANILNMILGSPQLNDPAMMTFFAAFPCQLGMTLKFDQTRDDGIAYLRQFMPELPRIWQTMETECRQRQYPPTIVEMAGYMRVLSPTLMRIFFTAARRMAWPCLPEQESAAQMTQIFSQAETTFTRARNVFFDQFESYQQNDEVQDYQRLQKIFLRLRQTHFDQNQFVQVQHRQGQAIRMQHGVPQQTHLQQTQLAQAQLQIQRHQAQQRQMSQTQPQRAGMARPIQVCRGESLHFETRFPCDDVGIVLTYILSSIRILLQDRTYRWLLDGHCRGSLHSTILRSIIIARYPPQLLRHGIISQAYLMCLLHSGT